MSANTSSSQGVSDGEIDRTTYGEIFQLDKHEQSCSAEDRIRRTISSILGISRTASFIAGRNAKQRTASASKLVEWTDVHLEKAWREDTRNLSYEGWKASLYSQKAYLSSAVAAMKSLNSRRFDEKILFSQYPDHTSALQDQLYALDYTLTYYEKLWKDPSGTAEDLEQEQEQTAQKLMRISREIPGSWIAVQKWIIAHHREQHREAPMTLVSKILLETKKDDIMESVAIVQAGFGAIYDVDDNTVFTRPTIKSSLIPYTGLEVMTRKIRGRMYNTGRKHREDMADWLGSKDYAKFRLQSYRLAVEEDLRNEEGSILLSDVLTKGTGRMMEAFNEQEQALEEVWSQIDKLVSDTERSDIGMSANMEAERHREGWLRVRDIYNASIVVGATIREQLRQNSSA